jgi:hypothetical protein
MILNDLCFLDKVLLFLSGMGLGSEVGGGELAEDVDVLAHEEAGLVVFFLVLFGFYLLGFLHSFKSCLY